MRTVIEDDVDVVEKYINGIRYYITKYGLFPSVTSIINKMLGEPFEIKIWKLNTPDWKKMLERYKTEGNFIHYRILSKYSIRALDPPAVNIEILDDDLIYKIELAEMMWNELDISKRIDPILIEKVLVCKEHQFAGKPDLLAKIDDETVIIDLKRSSEPNRKQYLLQLSAYAYAYGLNRVDKGMVISLCPDEYINENLEAKIVVVNKKKLSSFSVEFLSIVKEFYKKYELPPLDFSKN